MSLAPYWPVTVPNWMEPWLPHSCCCCCCYCGSRALSQVRGPEGRRAGLGRGGGEGGGAGREWPFPRPSRFHALWGWRRRRMGLA